MKRIKLPDRFEKIRRINEEYHEFIVENEEGLEKIDELCEEMDITYGGSFLILKGESGVGKTTFLNTVNIFRNSVEILTIHEDDDIVENMQKLKKSKFECRIIIIEGRESYKQVKYAVLERELRAINSFIRKEESLNTIIAWPLNEDGMIEDILDTAKRIGGESLISRDNILFFDGPDKGDYYDIVNKTFGSLNEGMDINHFGISKETAEIILENSNTLGDFISKVVKEINRLRKKIKDAKKYELNNVWIVVVAGNNPSDAINNLTYGKVHKIDTERLFRATNANIVNKIKDESKFKLFVNEINAKILFLPAEIVRDIILSTENENLKTKLIENGLELRTNTKSKLDGTILGDALLKHKIKRKYKCIKEKVDRFDIITKIASKNDVILNSEIGDVLKKEGIIYKYETEQLFAGVENRRTDILCNLKGDYVRLEMMWRERVSEADIARYTLEKIYNYATTINFFE